MNIENLIILAGLKGCGKSSVARYLMEHYHFRAIDLDEKIVEIFRTHNIDRDTDTDAAHVTDENSSPEPEFRTIYRMVGKRGWRRLERKALSAIVDNLMDGSAYEEKSPVVIALGGGTIENGAAIRKIARYGEIIYLMASPQSLYERMEQKGLPPFLKKSPLRDVRRQWEKLANRRMRLCKKWAAQTIDVNGRLFSDIAADILRWCDGTTV